MNVCMYVIYIYKKLKNKQKEWHPATKPLNFRGQFLFMWPKVSCLATVLRVYHCAEEKKVHTPRTNGHPFFNPPPIQTYAEGFL